MNEMIANPDGIKARPVGRTLRLILGLLLVFEGGRHLVGASSTLLATTVGVVAAEFVLYAVMHLAIVRLVPTVNRWLGAFLAVAPVFLIYVLSDAPGKLGSLLFIGISLLFTAARNDGGCEVMTMPGMVFGRRTHLVCIAFSPIDWVEERLAKRR